MSTGIIHSTESCGTVDGPGVRFVVFFKGCPMRCAYCHNPDTWSMEGGTEMTVDELLKEYETKKFFYKSGGITATGGEPMVQIDFLTELFTEAHKRGIHTCLDTSGVTFRPDDPANLMKVDKLLEVTDLVMLDIKHINPQEHLKLCKQPNDNILAFAKYLDKKGIQMWIRHVVATSCMVKPARMICALISLRTLIFKSSLNSDHEAAKQVRSPTHPLRCIVKISVVIKSVQNCRCDVLSTGGTYRFSYSA